MTKQDVGIASWLWNQIIIVYFVHYQNTNQLFVGWKIFKVYFYQLRVSTKSYLVPLFNTFKSYL